MKEDPEKPRKMRRREENDDAPSTPVNDVGVTLFLYSSGSGIIFLKGSSDDHFSQVDMILWCLNEKSITYFG